MRRSRAAAQGSRAQAGDEANAADERFTASGSRPAKQQPVFSTATERRSRRETAAERAMKPTQRTTASLRGHFQRG